MSCSKCSINNFLNKKKNSLLSGFDGAWDIPRMFKSPFSVVNPQEVHTIMYGSQIEAIVYMWNYVRRCDKTEYRERKC